MDVVATYTDIKARQFELVIANDEYVRMWTDRWIAVEDDDAEYGLTRCTVPETMAAPTEKEREADKELLARYADYTEADWIKIIKNLPTKKNGMLAKNRVYLVQHFSSFAWNDNETYGHRIPTIRIKTLDENTAVLELMEDIVRR